MLPAEISPAPGFLDSASGFEHLCGLQVRAPIAAGFEYLCGLEGRAPIAAGFEYLCGLEGRAPFLYLMAALARAPLREMGRDRQDACPTF
jgi:hypothetical protein